MLPTVPLKDMDTAMLTFELIDEITKARMQDPQRSQGPDTVVSAVQVATRLHRGQTRRVRKDIPVTPYIEHPLRVALRIIRWQGTEDFEVIAAALLHDSVEDCSEIIAAEFTDEDTTALEWISQAYGPTVAETVAEVTNEDSVAYSEKIATLCEHGSDRALLVKASDMVDNAGSLPHQLHATGQGRTARLARKYLAVMPLLIKELTARSMTVPAQRLRRVELNCRDLV